jgi:ligand-binding SRPBCC domain-containing protein
MATPYTVRESATVQAPIERVFYLSTRVELVRETLGMNLVADPAPDYIASGHIGAHSRVHWHGWKFGLPTHHHTLITGYAAPHAEADGVVSAWFQDSQAKGRFATFQHDHHFRQSLDPLTQCPVTMLFDEVNFTLPFGVLGRLAAGLLLAPHIRKLCRQRFGRIKALAESDAWRAFVDPALLPGSPDL